MREIEFANLPCLCGVMKMLPEPSRSVRGKSARLFTAFPFSTRITQPHEWQATNIFANYHLLDPSQGVSGNVHESTPNSETVE